MKERSGELTVLTAPLFDPGVGRTKITLEEGKNLSEIVACALPCLTSEDMKQVRVALVSASGSMVIDAEHWSRVKPKAGTSVVIRVIPAKSILRAVLSIVVSIAAIALGQFWAAPLLGGGMLGSIGAMVVGAGVPPLGTLQIDQLQ